MAETPEMTTDTATSTTTETPPTQTPTTEAPATPEASPAADEDEATILGSAGKKADEGDAGGAGAAKQDGPPETYEITLTDANGNAIELDAEMLAEATPLLREAGLSNDAANKLAPLALKFMERGQAAADAANEAHLAALKKQWAEEFRAGPLGGAKADETIAVAAKALDALGFTEGHPFRGLLDATGLGNHPDMIAAFYRLGQLLSEEDKFANPSGASETRQVGHIDLYKT
jgi:hypothetical protein